jgi:hypothetical protein
MPKNLKNQVQFFKENNKLSEESASLNTKNPNAERKSSDDFRVLLDQHKLLTALPFVHHFSI